MQSISHRPCDLHADQQALIELLLAYRLASSLLVYPTIWRIRLLLSSRVWEPALDTRLWLDAAGQMAGFAMLWRRQRNSNYLVLERFMHPALAIPTLAGEMLDWGVSRVRAIAAADGAPLTLYANALDPRVAPADPLEACGFTPVPRDPQVHNVYFSRSLQESLPAVTLPAGYTIQRLQTPTDLAAYQELYDFAAVNPQHLQEQFASDEYAHQVVADPAGSFQAYCEYAICRAEWQPGQPRIGWIDYVGTRPAQQQRGLGRAVLLASLEGLRLWGAESVRLVTISNNLPAIRLYQATGFSQVEVSEPASYQQAISAI